MAEKDEGHTAGWDKERDGNMRDFATADDAIKTIDVED